MCICYIYPLTSLLIIFHMYGKNSFISYILLAPFLYSLSFLCHTSRIFAKIKILPYTLLFSAPLKQKMREWEKIRGIGENSAYILKEWCMYGENIRNYLYFIPHFLIMGASIIDILPKSYNNFLKYILFW